MPDKIERVDLEELKKLKEGTTDAPWAWMPGRKHATGEQQFEIGQLLEDDPPFAEFWRELDGGSPEANVRYVVALVNSAPFLIAELEDLRARVLQPISKEQRIEMVKRLKEATAKMLADANIIPSDQLPKTEDDT